MENASSQPEPAATPQLSFGKPRHRPNLPRGILGGVAGGLLGAILWAAFTYFTGYHVGWIAVGVGVLVGFGVSRLGHGADLRFAIAGAVIAFLSTVLGNFLVAMGYLARYWDVSILEALLVFNYAMTLQLLVDTFEFIDILFYALAVAAGFQFSRLDARRRSPAPAGPVSQAAPATVGGVNAFNARLISALSPDRLYRVLFDRGEIFFIQIGGQSFGQAIAAQFGFLGQSIYAPVQDKARARLEARIRELDTQPPSAHLRAGKHNFSAAVSDFEKSTLKATSAVGQHGPHFGRWVVQLRGQKPRTLQLETEDDMQRAFESLPAAIGAHENQVAWDAARGKFTRTA